MLRWIVMWSIDSFESDPGPTWRTRGSLKNVIYFPGVPRFKKQCLPGWFHILFHGYSPGVSFLNHIFSLDLFLKEFQTTLLLKSEFLDLHKPSGPILDYLSTNLHFNKIPRWFIYKWKFGKSCHSSSEICLFFSPWTWNFTHSVCYGYIKIRLSWSEILFFLLLSSGHL